jgi:enoyl-CoA hydratase/carnithine racemase/carbon monoxide dehydrogenase subunit G
MEMVGEARIEASRETVWDALNDPQVLQSSIPGCEELSRTADNEFTAKVVSKVGPIKARFSGKVTLSNIDAPRSYTLTGEGQGGPAGFVKSDIEVSLEALEPRVTMLRYGVKANVGGKLAQLGSRMIDAAARKAADEFFGAFGNVVARRADSAPQQSTSAMDMDTVAFVEAATAPGFPEPRPRPAPAVARAAAPAAAVNESMPSELMDVWVSQHIKVWIADQVAVVSLNRPDNRNAMTYAMWRAMPGLMRALERNPEVRTVILTGAGEDFCSGADIPEFEKVRADVDQATAYEVAVDACCDAIASISKPTIAVVKGYCLGGGAHLAMSCDFSYAAASAVFGIPAARLSIIYGVRATQKLRALVGQAHAKRILYSADRFTATEALRIGFVDQVSGSLEAAAPNGWWAKLWSASGSKVVDPMADARTFARKLGANAPLSIAGAKYILTGLSMGPGDLDLGRAEEMIAAAAGSEDYREGRKAFAEKRVPGFKGF